LGAVRKRGRKQDPNATHQPFFRELDSVESERLN
jgi:hypothetical protein